MNHQELIERLRGFEIDHDPKGWPAIQMRDISDMCNAIESLLAENERLKAELAKYRDAPIVGWQWLNTGTYRKNIKNAALYRDWRPLIVKPVENK